MDQELIRAARRADLAEFPVSTIRTKLRRQEIAYIFETTRAYIPDSASVGTLVSHRMKPGIPLTFYGNTLAIRSRRP